MDAEVKNEGFSIRGKDALEKIKKDPGFYSDLAHTSVNYISSQFGRIRDIVDEIGVYMKQNKEMLALMRVGLVVSGNVKVMDTCVTALNVATGDKEICEEAIDVVKDFLNEGGK